MNIDEQFFVVPPRQHVATFGEALAALKDGKSVQRAGWNGKGLWLTLQKPDANSKMTLPYIYISYPTDAPNTPGARVPWLASQTDLLAEDWCVA
jgi:tripartite-type tricarboxylate transporter receptor subunit TctC